MPRPSLISQVSSEQQQITELLRTLVEMESPSTDKPLVDRVGSYICSHLRACGYTPQIEHRSECGDIIWAEWPATDQGRILVLCHLDTVWERGTLAKNPFHIQGGRIYGPGIFDMKSGVAATLKIQEYLARGWIQARRRVRFLYTTDEEPGSYHSRGLIEQFASMSDLVLIPEPPLPGGGLKTFRKGSGYYLVKIFGRAAHAGVEPEKGINAVEALASLVQDVHALAAPAQGTTVNVTTARGGSRENVIPDYAQAGFDVRFRIIPEGDRLDRSIRSMLPRLPGTRLEVTGGIDRPPMLRTERTQRLFAQARVIAAELGIDLQEGESGGGSDGCFSAALGIPTLDGLGIEGDGAHALHEHIALDRLAPRIALLARLIERL